jgi:hypothetical protein
MCANINIYVFVFYIYLYIYIYMTNNKNICVEHMNIYLMWPWSAQTLVHNSTLKISTKVWWQRSLIKHLVIFPTLKIWIKSLTEACTQIYKYIHISYNKNYIYISYKYINIYIYICIYIFFYLYIYISCPVDDAHNTGNLQGNLQGNVQGNVQGAERCLARKKMFLSVYVFTNIVPERNDPATLH